MVVDVSREMLVGKEAELDCHEFEAVWRESIIKSLNRPITELEILPNERCSQTRGSHRYSNQTQSFRRKQVNEKGI